MKNPNPTLLCSPSIPHNLRYLTFRDHISFDYDPMRRLYHDLGPHQAEEHICQALEQIARLLQRLQWAQRDRRFESMIDQCRILSSTAYSLGLMTLARITLDVGICARARDYNAVCATLARLDRIAEPSMMEVWSSYGEAP